MNRFERRRAKSITRSQPAPVAAGRAEGGPTRLIVAAIDPDAPGSFQLDRQRREINAQIEETIDEFNALVDPFNELREAVAAHPENEEYAARMTETASRLSTARMAMEAARDRRRQFIIGRLSTNDGTPVEAALERISLSQFEALISGVMDGIIVPN